MIKELQILVEVEKSLKILETVDFQGVSDLRHQGMGDLRHHLENIRNLQLQSFVENETYNFVLADALQIKETQTRTNEKTNNDKRSYVQTATYVSRH